MSLRSALVSTAGKFLGYDELDDPQDPIFTATTVADISVAVTLPANHLIRIHAHLPLEINPEDGNTVVVRIRDQVPATIATGIWGFGHQTLPVADVETDVWAIFVSPSTPTAKTYTIQVEPTEVGGVVVNVSPASVRKAFLSVEDLGPA